VLFDSCGDSNNEILLQHADHRWFALYKDFVFENIAVSHDKEIFLLDYEELSIIENLDFDEPSGLYGINVIILK